MSSPRHIIKVLPLASSPPRSSDFQGQQGAMGNILQVEKGTVQIYLFLKKKKRHYLSMHGHSLKHKTKLFDGSDGLAPFDEIPHSFTLCLSGLYFGDL